ncbi:MAG TPA: zinc ribbon domain-containing protein [Methylomirabilota bacterium]|nr:zinc ribbon domain-containing protein [Methylomirabilota bacterium]
MPTYEYQCQQCRRTFEVRQRITEEPLRRCEECGGTLQRLLSPAPFILKGEGWYVTDYPSQARKKALEAEKSGTKPDAKDAASAEKSSTSATKDASTTSDSAGASPPAEKPSA